MGQITLSGATKHQQRGVALLITLMMLFIITISALGMLLMTQSGTTAAGNIAFRQAAVRVADLAIEDARVFLLNHTATYKQSDDPGAGYWANFQASFDPGSFPFTDLTQARQYTNGGIDTFSGYKIYYIVHRMAKTSNLACLDPLAQCMYAPNANGAATIQGGSQAGGAGYSNNIAAPQGLVYYRITIKVVGPKHNNRIVQAFLY